MNEVIEAIVLGIIQGLTEFLPVSSSGHLEIGKYLFGNKYTGETGFLMTVVLHVATALATILVFRKDIARIFRQLFDRNDPAGRIFALKIVLSMIPAVIVGLTLEKEIEQLFTGQMLLVGTCLLITGLLLFWADRPYAHHRPLRYQGALWMGIAQAIAILPGISRSGATIGTALLLRIERSEAARFSFLMVVPLILGKVAKDILDGSMESQIAVQGLPLVAGFVAALVSGWLACSWMIALVRKARLRYFAWYCFVAGSFAILSQILR